MENRGRETEAGVKRTILLIAVMAFAGCSNKPVPVKIVFVKTQEEFISQERRSSSWNNEFAHTVVERMDNKRRYWIRESLGNVGDEFTMTENELRWK